MRIAIKNTKNIKELLFIAFINVTFIFSFFVFVPYEMYLGNIVEFKFRLSDFKAPIIIGVVFFLMLFCLNLSLRDSIRMPFLAFVFGVMVAGYIQSMFLNGFMEKLDGSEIEWSKTNININLFIWCAIVLFSVILCIFKKKVWLLISEVCTLVIFGAQFVAMIIMLISADRPAVETVISSKGILEVAKESNVFVICLDKFDQKYMETILEKYPDALDGLGGFTYYPNTTGKYCYTHIAIPYLLTGQTIPEYNPTDEQFCEQMESSAYWNAIIDNVDNVGVYTDEWCIRSAEARESIYNCVDAEYIIDSAKMNASCIKASLYRTMPFIIKPTFEYDSTDFNEAVETVGDNQEYNADSYETVSYLIDELSSNGMSINDDYGNSAFRFVHTMGAHPEYHLDENGEYSDEITSPEQCAVGTLLLVRKYCDELERLGLFEKATIIVTADHGDTHVLNEEDNEERNVNPLLLYKPAGVGRNGKFETSLAPASHDDIFATVLSAYGIAHSQFAYSLDDVYEGMERKRIFYWCYQDPEITDRESCIHIEYEIDGDSRENENWRQTGRWIYPNNNPRHEDISKQSVE